MEEFRTEEAEEPEERITLHLCLTGEDAKILQSEVENRWNYHKPEELARDIVLDQIEYFKEERSR